MRRRIFTSVAIFWLLLSATFVVLWIGSYMKGMWYEHAWVRQTQGEPRLFHTLATSRTGAVRFNLLRRRYLVYAIAVPNVSKASQERIRAINAAEAMNQLAAANAFAADVNASAAQRAKSSGPPHELRPHNPWLGFDLLWEASSTHWEIGLRLPYWFLATVAGGVALLCRRLRRRRFGEGFCPVCGYDMRATPNNSPSAAWSQQQRDVLL